MNLQAWIEARQIMLESLRAKIDSGTLSPIGVKNAESLIKQIENDGIKSPKI